MGFCGKFTLIAVSSLAIFLGVKVNRTFFEVPSAPTLEETWWGPGQSTKEDTSIKPFKINVGEDVST